jgi:hypothetical protein
MQLGKKLAAGFVSDDVHGTAPREAEPPLGGADAKAPGASRLPAPQPEPATAG